MTSSRRSLSIPSQWSSINIIIIITMIQYHHRVRISRSSVKSHGWKYNCTERHSLTVSRHYHSPWLFQGRANSSIAQSSSFFIRLSFIASSTPPSRTYITIHDHYLVQPPSSPITIIAYITIFFITCADGLLGSHYPHHFKVISGLHGALLYPPGNDSPSTRYGAVGKYIDT